MSEQNKALCRRFYEEVFNKGNLAVIDELSAPNFVDHTAPPGVAPGAEGMKQLITMYRTAFPDLQLTVEEMVAEGDTVVTRTTMRGTHKGELMGIPPTGKHVTMRGLDLVRLTGGKAVEVWHHDDELGMMQQLGVVPPPGQTGA